MPLKVFFLKLEDVEKLGIEDLVEITAIDGKEYAFLPCDIDQNETPFLKEALLYFGFKGSEEEAEKLAEKIEELACGEITLW